MYADSNLKRPDIKLETTDDSTIGKLSDEKHGELLEYLLQRLKIAQKDRPARLKRYSKIDKLISTWQRLSKEDSKREEAEDNTGRQQAVSMNLPILATHLDDMVAFFAEVYSTTSADFYTVPAAEEAEPAKALAKLMNRDAKARKYYKELCSGMRSLIKYNIGGYAIRYEKGGGLGQLAEPGNRNEAIDMYNYMWDPTVTDVSKICTEAEYAARLTQKSDMWLLRGAKKGELSRVDRILAKTSDPQSNRFRSADGNKAVYYKMPPAYVGLATDGSDDKTTPTQTADWEAYGATLESDHFAQIQGHEVIEMFCWMNPFQFGLIDSNVNDLKLWRFTIVDCEQVVKAEAVEGVNDTDPEIPHYLGHMTVDDMKEAQRSIMELMRPFQRFVSFLANIYVVGARKNIWGFKGVDPNMFDINGIDKGDVAGWLVSKQPGRDVRAGLMTLDSTSGVEKIPDMIGFVMDLMQRFFPSQGLPSQIAQIDRAVKSQVSTVMQGVQRRLHMVCKIIDTDIMGPARVQQYRNLAIHEGPALKGMTEEIVAKVLGSALNQLNREMVASELKEILFAIMQNPSTASAFDMMKIFTFWSQMLDSPVDLGDFVMKQVQDPNAVPPGTPGTPGAAPTNPMEILGASGLQAGPATQVLA